MGRTQKAQKVKAAALKKVKQVKQKGATSKAVAAAAAAASAAAEARTGTPPPKIIVGGERPAPPPLKRGKRFYVARRDPTPAEKEAAAKAAAQARERIEARVSPAAAHARVNAKAPPLAYTLVDLDAVLADARYGGRLTDSHELQLWLIFAGVLVDSEAEGPPTAAATAALIERCAGFVDSGPRETPASGAAAGPVGRVRAAAYLLREIVTNGGGTTERAVAMAASLDANIAEHHIFK